MLTPVKHRNHISGSFVLEQSWAPGRSAVRWAPYASRWTLIFWHPLDSEIISQFYYHKKQRNAVSQGLGITYSFSSFLLSSGAGYALYQGMKTCHVSLFILLIALKCYYAFYLKQLAETVGFWKIIWMQQKTNVKWWFLAHGAKLLPCPTIPMAHSQSEPVTFSALLELLIVLLSKINPPLIHPRLFSLWKTLCHGLASAQPCVACVAPKWRGHQLFPHSAWNVLLMDS